MKIIAEVKNIENLNDYYRLEDYLKNGGYDFKLKGLRKLEKETK